VDCRLLANFHKGCCRYTLKHGFCALCRLLFIWEAYETAQYVYNASYLAYYDGVVNYLWQQLGIKSIVDVHQVRACLLNGLLSLLGISQNA
jgi:hypothetical protein